MLSNNYLFLTVALLFIAYYNKDKLMGLYKTTKKRFVLFFSPGCGHC